MAIIPWIEKNVHGDKNFLKDIKYIGQQGYNAYGTGTGVSGEGVNLLRDLNNRYSSRLDSGNILDPSLTRAFNVARGGVKDTAGRALSSARARLGQRAAESGGRLSAAATAELEQLAAENVGQQEFQSLNDVNFQEAGMTQTATTDLMDRLERARSGILGAGQFQQQIGQQAQLASILARLDRHKAIASTFSSIMGGFTGR